MNHEPVRQTDQDVVSQTWLASLRAFQHGSTTRSILQILNTLVPLALLWLATAYIVKSGLPYPLAFLTILPASFFLVRTFILFHDCCHGSFFRSRRANRIVGYLAGALTFTPFEAWRWSHLRHHATNSQLDHRGLGDEWMMTLEEFRDAKRSKRLAYRLYRFPFIHFIFGSFFLFFVLNRIPPKGSRLKERWSTHITTLIILVAAAAWSLLLGFRTYLLVQIPILWIAAIVGVWLFFVQHQFDPGYWARDAEWNRIDASLRGASYYKLPKILRWLTGNIGLHHIHHLLPNIPNYRLVPALEAIPEVQIPNPLTIRESLASLHLHLWHEEARRFLGFREARRLMSA